MIDPTAPPPPGPDYGAGQPAFPPAEPLTFDARPPVAEPTPAAWTAPQTSAFPEAVAPAAVTVGPTGVVHPYGQTPPGWPEGTAGYPGYPAAQPGYPAAQPGYPAGYPAYPGGYPAYSQPRTNGMAIASMIVSLVALPGLVCYAVPGLIMGIVGAILGHVARRKIKQTGENGDGMALTGVIVGWVTVGLSLLALAGLIWLFIYAANQDPSYYNDYSSDTY
jgi:hypothetical protein